MNGGYWFGAPDGERLPFINPVSAAFACQALELWETGRSGCGPAAPPLADLNELKR